MSLIILMCVLLLCLLCLYVKYGSWYTSIFEGYIRDPFPIIFERCKRSLYQLSIIRSFRWSMVSRASPWNVYSGIYKYECPYNRTGRLPSIIIDDDNNTTTMKRISFYIILARQVCWYAHTHRPSQNHSLCMPFHFFFTSAINILYSVRRNKHIVSSIAMLLFQIYLSFIYFINITIILMTLYLFLIKVNTIWMFLYVKLFY